MKLSIIPLFLALAAATPTKDAAVDELGLVLDFDPNTPFPSGDLIPELVLDEDQDPSSPANSTDVEGEDISARQSGCVIRAYRSTSCGGTSMYAYEYSPVRNSCRSCRNFSRARSFRTSGNCGRYHRVQTKNRQCSQSATWHPYGGSTGTGQCWRVNTPGGWNSGRMCFG
ncbi:hypothetical protein PspLS_10274 [Pyricularia sp. CBS 133598]|nr:hypothetical protein PspLS_10274 [Pyricularia sp. CBS 133598]